MTAKEDMRKLMDQLAREMGEDARIVDEDGHKVVDQYTPSGKKKLSESIKEVGSIEIFIDGEKTDLSLLELVKVIHIKQKLS